MKIPSLIGLLHSMSVFILSAIAILFGVTKLSCFGTIVPGAFMSWQRMFEGIYAPYTNALLASYNIPFRVNHEYLRIAVGVLEISCGILVLFGSKVASITLSIFMVAICGILYYNSQEDDGMAMPLCLTAMCIFVSMTKKKSG